MRGKREYKKPELETHGTLEEITKGGTRPHGQEAPDWTHPS